MSSEEDYYQENDQHSEEIPSALQEMYGDDDEEMDSEELRDMQNKNQLNSDDSIYDEQEEEENEISDENENESSDQDEDSEIDNEQNEEFEKKQQFNEKIRKLQQSKGDEFHQNLHSLFINIPSEKQNQIESSKLLQKQDQSKSISDLEKQQLKNDTEDFQSHLQNLQKALLENNFPIFNQNKLLSNKKSGLDLKHGLGFLNSKSLLFQEYMINLNIYLLKKIQGEPLNQEFVKNLLYQKTLLQKMKPVEKKLDYQIQKMLKLAEKKNTKAQTKKASQIAQHDIEDDEDDLDEDDPYNHKPNPSQLQKTDDDNNDDKNLNTNKNAKYVAPKLVSALSKEEKLEQFKQRQEEKRKNYLRRQLTDNFVNDNDRTKEIKESQHGRQIIDKRQLERQRYEEENFIRLPVTRKDKALERKIQRKVEIGGERLDDFTEQKQIRELLTHENIIDKSNSKKSYVSDQNKKRNNTFSSSSSSFNGKRKGGFKGKSKGGKKKVKR